MTPSRYPHITDELLSAYLDEAVTAEEKRLIEAAIADEPALAWRLETLRQTVHLVRTLPAIALPRSFTLSELSGVARQPAPALSSASPAQRSLHAAPQQVIGLAALWQGWLSFWQLGSPLLRNAAAVSLALFLFLIVGDAVGSPPFGQRSEPASAPFSAEAPLAAVAPTAATAASLETPSAQPSEETADLAAQQEVAPAAAPAAMPQADEGEAGRAAAASEGEPASAVAASQPALQAREQVEARTSGAAAPGPEGEVGVASSGLPGDMQSDTASDTAESLSVAMATQRALSATAAATDTMAEAAPAHEEPLPEAASLSDTEAMTDAGPVEGLAADGASVPSVQSDEAAPPIPTALAKQAEETATLATGAELSDNTTVAPQPVEQVQPAQEDGPTGSRQRSLLDLSQIVTGLVTLVFGALWWRSRSQHSPEH
jgi:anti-sigma factor RsiW